MPGAMVVSTAEAERRRDLRDDVREMQPLADSQLAPARSPLYGHERPSLIVATPEDGRRHTAALDKEAERLISGPRGQGRGEERRAEIALQRTMEAAEWQTNALGYAELEARDQRMQAEVLSGWLGEDVLGPLVHGRMSAAPPVLTTESLSLMDRLSEEFGIPDIQGLYMGDSNHVMIAVDVPLEADRRRIIVHEDLHYASWLGGGMDGISYSGVTRSPFVSWLHEGSVELSAQEITRAHGETPASVAYPEATLAAEYMERVLALAAGSEELASSLLRQACITGDYTRVGELLDSKLGSGTFATLIGAQPLPGGGFVTNGAEAFFFLEGRAAAAGLDTSGWQARPIPSAIERQLTLVSGN